MTVFYGRNAAFSSRPAGVRGVRNPAAPVSSTSPSVTGSLAVGETLTADPGVWSNAPTGYLYQWLANGSPIQGANGPNFSPATAQAGTSVGVIVTAVNARGATAAAASAGVVAGTVGGVSRLPGTTGVVAPPSASGYAYVPPFTVTRQASGTFVTSYDIDAAKPAYANTIYVAPDGANASDGLTYANRVRSLKQAITRANALGGTVRLLVDPGIYKLSSVVSSVEDRFAGLAITCCLVIECSAPGGRIVSLADVIVPAFAATASNASVFVSTYTTQAVGNIVVDFAAMDGRSRPKAFRRVFPAATNEATVVAALNARLSELTAAGNTRFAGASYVDATSKKVYLKRLSSVAPDANVTVFSSAQYNLNHQPAAGQACTIWLCPELEVWGGVQPFRSVSNATGNVTVWAKGCGYGYSHSSHGFSVSGGACSSFAVGTEVFCCGQDGFNYNGVAGVASISFHEIGAKAFSTGLAGDADGSYNASTSHMDCRGVRVGCTYEDNSNRTIHDIQNAQTWNLGIVVNPNRFAGNGQAWDASYASGLLTLANASLVFLDACTSPAANSFDLEAYDGSKLFFANMDVSVATNDVSGSGLSLQAYAA